MGPAGLVHPPGRFLVPRPPAPQAEGVNLSLEIFLSCGHGAGRQRRGRGGAGAGPPRHAAYPISRHPPILNAGGRGHTWGAEPAGGAGCGVLGEALT